MKSGSAASLSLIWADSSPSGLEDAKYASGEESDFNLQAHPRQRCSCSPAFLSSQTALDFGLGSERLLISCKRQINSCLSGWRPRRLGNWNAAPEKPNLLPEIWLQHVHFHAPRPGLVLQFVQITSTCVSNFLFMLGTSHSRIYKRAQVRRVFFRSRASDRERVNFFRLPLGRFG